MARACAPGEKFLNIQPIAVRSEPWFERLINKSSTCCSRVPFTRLSSFSSLVNKFPKQWGLTWIPYKTVHVYWVIYRVSVQSLSHVWLFATPWTVALQASLSITNSWSLLSPSSWWCHPTISSSVIPFSSCLQSFLASGSFQMHQFFASGSRSIRVAGVRVPPFKGKRYCESGCRGIQKNASLRFQTNSAPWHLCEEGVWVWYQWVNRDDCPIHCS